MRSITYLGHSSVKIQLGNIIMLFNPTISNPLAGHPRIEKPALNPSAIKECDLIFLSNEEPTNCEPTTINEIAERCFSYIIGPKQALSKVSISEKFKIDVHMGDKFNVKGLDIEVVKAVHPQSIYPVGYLIRGENASIYYAGDTYSFNEMSKIKCDVAIVPIGGGSVMDPFAASLCIKEIRPKIAIPIAYNTYEKNRQDPEDFLEDLGGMTRGVALKLGQDIRF
jgi:L-ascorbate metabolism protein UlaG (beta-lactamase superfamily)